MGLELGADGLARLIGVAVHEAARGRAPGGEAKAELFQLVFHHGLLDRDEIEARGRRRIRRASALEDVELAGDAVGQSDLKRIEGRAAVAAAQGQVDFVVAKGRGLGLEDRFDQVVQEARGLDVGLQSEEYIAQCPFAVGFRPRPSFPQIKKSDAS